MVAYELTDYLEPSMRDLDAAWQSVIARPVPSPDERQVNFIPCEVLLCLCAMRVVDHTGFGSGSAERAPSPISELARLFKRPNSSMLAKMANLDGSRPNGGRHDRAVFAHFSSDRRALDAVYQQIMSAARRAGIGADQLTDFLHLLDRPEQEDGIRWLHGLDGQIIVDPTHIWITRDGVLDFPHSTDPIRAPRTAVSACRVLAHESDSTTRVHIVVDGADDLAVDCRTHPEAVRFGNDQRAEIEFLTELFAGPVHMRQSPADAYVEWLDNLDGIATLRELLDLDPSTRSSGAAAQPVDVPEFLAQDPRVTTSKVGDVWIVAAGAPADAVERAARIVDLGRLVHALPPDTGIGPLADAARSTSLAPLSRARLLTLWAAVAGAVTNPESQMASRVAKHVSAKSTLLPVHQTRRPGRVTTGLRTPTTKKAPPPVRAPEVETRKPEAPRKDSQAPAAPTLVRKNAMVGHRWRVILVVAGFRTVAMCDPVSGAVEITLGALKGRRFPDPTTAAAAVIERDEPGHDRPGDGWATWLLDDGSGRPVAAVRGGARR